MNYLSYEEWIDGKEEYTNNDDTYNFHKCPYDEKCAFCVNNTSVIYPWNELVDQVFCICVRERDDRFKDSCREFHKVGLCQFVVFYRPFSMKKELLPTSIPVYDVGKYACYESHRYVMTHSYKMQYQRILTFEDDLVFLPHFNVNTLQRMIHHMKILQMNHIPWDIYYLGHSPRFGYKTNLDRHLYRTWSFYTHAMVCNRSGMKFMKNTPYETYSDHVDAVLQKHITAYAYKPMAVVQSSSPSERNLATSSYAKFLDFYVREFTATFPTVHEFFTMQFGFVIVIILVVLLIILLFKRYSRSGTTL